ncbi:unnamed protein product [Owenia fusiformis]|uniref:Uncharacterized protein n=1 Tax=Owenia fusiformis TaxID=6347 RepID=A0A8J1T5X9_OWEFU|nr:unnamed protein product [Owenia fusiformis]
MYFQKLLLVLLGIWIVIANVDGQGEQDILVTYREPRRNEATYMIVAPRRFRPNQVYRLHVVLLKLEHFDIHFHAVIRNVDQRMEVGSVSEHFDRLGGRDLEIKVPEFLVPGNYSLYVEGKHKDGVGGTIFHNETSLIFDTKQISVFIETDKMIYNFGNTATFRVIPVMPNLMPAHGTVDIFIRENSDVIVRRWLAQAINNGIIEKTFNIAGRLATRAVWTIEIHAFGHVYTKNIYAVEAWPERVVVNVTMPQTIKTSDYGLAGVVTGFYYPSWISLKGNGTIDFKVEGFDNSGFSIPIPYFEYQYHFMITMDELSRKTGVVDLSGKALRAKAWLYDYHYYETRWGEATTIMYNHGLEMFFVEDTVRTFKPKMPFDVHIAIRQIDGTRPEQSIVGYVEIQMNYQTEGGASRKQTERLPFPDDNIVTLTVIPRANDQLINFIVTYRGNDMVLPQIRMTSYRVFSMHNFYIQVQSSTSKPRVNSYMIFTVKTNTFVDTIFYHIVCMGNIVLSNQLHMSSLQKTFSVAISRDMMPSARLVAYFVKRGEVIADALSFYVDPTALHEVDLEINWGKDFGPSFVEVIGEADPGTLIAFNSLNYYLYHLGMRNFITEQDIVDELLTYDSHTNISASVSFRGENWEKDIVYFPTQTYGADANTTFVFAGLHVFTDANLTTVPSECNATNGWLTCYDGSCYRVEKRCDKQVDCKDGADESGCKSTDLELRRWNHQQDFYYWTLPYYEKYEHVSWMWNTDYTKPSGQSFSLAPPPMQPFTYVLSALSVSRDKGLGVTQTPINLVDVTRGMYSKCEFPKTARMGEQIGILLWLSSFSDIATEVLVTLPSSEDYKFVSVGNGLPNNYSPDLIDKDVQTLVYLPPGERRFVHIPILPRKIGVTRFSIDAQDFGNGEGCSGEIKISMDGVTNTWHTPYFVDLVKFSEIIIPDLWIPVPERFVLPEQRHHLYVPGSVSTKVSVVGDVVGPAFYGNNLEATNLLDIPSGTLESHFFEFSQNLWYMKYLKSTDQLTREIQTKALNTMNSVIPRILFHKNKEGGFQQVVTHPSSLWVTAYLLNQMKQARDTEWEHQFYIAPEFMNEMALWIVSRQNKSVGSFMELAPAYMRTMVPKLQTLNGKEDYWNITLTAHVVIALSGNLGLTGEASSAAEKAKNKGADFLAMTLDILDEPFDLAIVTYALHAAEHRMKGEFFAKLKKAHRNDLKDQWPYWSPKDIDSIHVETIDVTPFMYPNEPSEIGGEAVMATSYALMCYVLQNYLDDASKIMYWLQSRRRGKGVWTGTMDTTIAIEALSMYGLRNPNRDLYYMELTIEATSTPEWRRVITLNKDNFNVEQEVEVPKSWGSVRVTARGNGLALLQVTTKANVEFMDQLRAPGKPPTGIKRHFDLVMNLGWGGANHSIMYIEPCARWRRTDLGPYSMTAFFRIEIPTGYVIIKSELRAQMREYKEIIRNRVFGNYLNIYVEKIGTDWLCTKIRADRWYPVANASIQHSAMVAEYYQPDIQNRTLYTTYNLFTQHICMVCGSFQCPYCPFYNSADTITSQFTTLIYSLGLLSCFYRLSSSYMYNG